MVFSNRISYYLHDSCTPVLIENEFCVSEVSNYPEGELLNSRNEEFCGQKGTRVVKYFKEGGPDKFYLKYFKVPETLKH